VPGRRRLAALGCLGDANTATRIQTSHDVADGIEGREVPEPASTAPDDIDDRKQLLDRLTARARAISSDDDEPTLGNGSFDVEAVLEAVGSPDAALLVALSTGSSPRHVRQLIERGASPDVHFLDQSALLIAARNCPPSVTLELVRANANVDSRDARGWTPLMHAIDAHTQTLSRESVLMHLLDAGAAIDVWSDDLKGPLDLMRSPSHHKLLRSMPELSSRVSMPGQPSFSHSPSGITDWQGATPAAAAAAAEDLAARSTWEGYPEQEESMLPASPTFGESHPGSRH